MLSLSPEPRARGGKVPEGPNPPRGCALRGPGGSTRHQGGPEQRRAPGRPRQAAAPPGTSPGRWLPSQPGAVAGTRESRAPRHRSTRSPARPPGTRSHLAQKAPRRERREMPAAASWNFADIAAQLRSSEPLAQEEAEAAAESRGIARQCLRLAGCRRLPPPGTQRSLLKAPAAG